MVEVASADAQQPAGDVKPTPFEEFETLPVGLKVVHEPNPVLATKSGRSARRKKYTWWFRTTVEATSSDVRIIEFGAYARHNGKWVFANVSRKPFTAQEFAEWYSCAEALVKKGKHYADGTNWWSGPELVASKSRWYYIGIDEVGQRVRGDAIVEHKADIDPKRPRDPETEDGAYVDLFNGQDLTGWVVEGTADTLDGEPVWIAEDGMIVCHGHGYGFLRYDRKVSDFSLKLDFRIVAGANSGFGIRHRKFTGERRSRPSFSGYEIQLIDDMDKPPSKTSSGSLYRYVAPKTQAMKPAGEWNSIAIQCRGPRITVTLNGKVIHDLDQSSVEEIAKKPLSGYLSLQNHGGEIAFRNIRLKELD